MKKTLNMCKSRLIPKRWSRLLYYAGWMMLGWALAGWMRRPQPRGTSSELAAPPPWGGGRPLGAHEQVRRAARERRECGAVCMTGDGRRGNFSEDVEPMVKEYQCEGFFRPGSLFDGISSELLEEIPTKLMAHFTYGGRVRVVNGFLRKERDLAPGAGGRQKDTERWWPRSQLDRMGSMYLSGSVHVDGSLSDELNVQVISALNSPRFNASGKVVLVVGSGTPWVETLLLLHGVKHIVTLDYVRIRTDHPNITTILPEDLPALYSGRLESLQGRFDLALAVGSLEHSGLGRYGEALDPWADLVTMARVRCLLKSGGRAFVAVPAAKQDGIVYNSFKCYGPVMLPHLLSNFKLLWTSHPFLVGAEPNCTAKTYTTFLLEKPQQ